MSTESPPGPGDGREQSTAHDWLNPYVLGSVHPNTQAYATFETKPTATLSDNPGKDSDPSGRSRYDTGGGYEHWRSYEYREHTRGESKEDVYASHHRLLAVVACYPLDMPLGYVLDDLRGKDVHHNAPEVDGERGVEWDNRPDCLEVLAHARHSAVTQQQRLSWARAKKERVEREESEPVGGRKECVDCGIGDDEAGMARVEGVEGVRCLSCARDAAGGGRSIEVL